METPTTNIGINNRKVAQNKQRSTGTAICQARVKAAIPRSHRMDLRAVAVLVNLTTRRDQPISMPAAMAATRTASRRFQYRWWPKKNDARQAASLSWALRGRPGCQGHRHQKGSALASDQRNGGGARTPGATRMRKSYMEGHKGMMRSNVLQLHRLPILPTKV